MRSGHGHSFGAVARGMRGPYRHAVFENPTRSGSHELHAVAAFARTWVAHTLASAATGKVSVGPITERSANFRKSSHRIMAAIPC